MAEIASGKERPATPFMTGKGAAAGSVWQNNRDDSAPSGLIAPPRAKASAAKPKSVATLPSFIEPQLAEAWEKPPTGPGWAYEIRFDGYRMQLRTVGGKATLLSRNGLDWSRQIVVGQVFQLERVAKIVEVMQGERRIFGGELDVVVFWASPISSTSVDQVDRICVPIVGSPAFSFWCRRLGRM